MTRIEHEGRSLAIVASSARAQNMEKVIQGLRSVDIPGFLIARDDVYYACVYPGHYAKAFRHAEAIYKAEVEAAVKSVEKLVGREKTLEYLGVETPSASPAVYLISFLAGFLIALIWF